MRTGMERWIGAAEAWIFSGSTEEGGGEGLWERRGSSSLTTAYVASNGLMDSGSTVRMNCNKHEKDYRSGMEMR
jgi:hypothetical protein